MAEDPPQAGDHGAPRLHYGQARAQWRKLIAASPLEVLQAVLRRLPGRPFSVDRLCLLRFDGLPRPRPALRRAWGEVRAAAPADVDAMARCEGKDREDFARRFTRGDQAVVALRAGAIVGYEWFCTAPSYFEEQFRFTIEIPPDGIYAYDAFIRTEHRLTGLWPKFKLHLADLMEQRDKRCVVTFVEYHNRLSLKTHVRFGFAPYRSVWAVRVGNRRLVWQRPIERRCNPPTESVSPTGDRRRP